MRRPLPQAPESGSESGSAKLDRLASESSIPSQPHELYVVWLPFLADTPDRSPTLLSEEYMRTQVTMFHNRIAELFSEQRNISVYVISHNILHVEHRIRSLAVRQPIPNPWPALLEACGIPVNVVDMDDGALLYDLFTILSGSYDFLGICPWKTFCTSNPKTYTHSVFFQPHEEFAEIFDTNHHIIETDPHCKNYVFAPIYTHKVTVDHIFGMPESVIARLDMAEQIEYLRKIFKTESARRFHDRILVRLYWTGLFRASHRLVNVLLQEIGSRNIWVETGCLASDVIETYWLDLGYDEPEIPPSMYSFFNIIQQIANPLLTCIFTRVPRPDEMLDFDLLTADNDIKYQFATSL